MVSSGKDAYFASLILDETESFGGNINVPNVVPEDNANRAKVQASQAETSIAHTERGKQFRRNQRKKANKALAVVWKRLNKETRAAEQVLRTGGAEDLLGACGHTEVADAVAPDGFVEPRASRTSDDRYCLGPKQAHDRSGGLKGGFERKRKIQDAQRIRHKVRKWALRRSKRHDPYAEGPSPILHPVLRKSDELIATDRMSFEVANSYDIPASLEINKTKLTNTINSPTTSAKQ